jgi:hypothetical protein
MQRFQAPQSATRLGPGSRRRCPDLRMQGSQDVGVAVRPALGFPAILSGSGRTQTVCRALRQR